MALRTVPLTRRDFFWDDPFFSNVWEDFDRMRQEIWQESRDFFNRFDRFDQQDKALKKDTESLKSSLLESSRAKKYSKMMEKSALSKNEISSDFDDFGDFGDFGKFTSRRWLMPRGFFDSEFTNFSELLPRTLLTHQLKVRLRKSRHANSCSKNQFFFVSSLLHFESSDRDQMKDKKILHSMVHL